MRALSLNHAVFGSADLERQVAYYEDIIGLHVAERDRGRVYLATRSGTDALILSQQPQTALSGLALQVGPAASAHDVARHLEAGGVAADIHTDPHPGVARSVNFVDCHGFAVELLCEPRLQPPGPARGVAALRLGHVAMAVRDVQAAQAFYRDILGFRLGDWIGDRIVFLRCGCEHHALNFIQSDHSGLQHVAFEMQNAATLSASCDVLANAGLRVVWGPVRHGPGHNIATYHENPEGQTIELYAEMDRMTNEALGYYDPRPWHACRPQRPKTWTTGGPQRDIWGPLGSPDFLKQDV